MKKLMMISCLLMMGVFIVSCEKDVIEPEIQLENNSSDIDFSKATSKGGLMDFVPSEVNDYSNKSVLESKFVDFKIAVVGDGSASLMLGVVNDVVSSNNLGTVTFLSPTDVVNGELINGNYNLFFLGRMFSIWNNGYAYSPNGFREQLELALNSGVGMITEWSGGSVVWTNLGNQNNYYQMLDDDGNLFQWFDGTIDRGDSGWSGSQHTNAAPQHEIMSGVPATFNICGSEYFYKLQNPDSSLSVIVTVASGNDNYPILLAGNYQGKGTVVFWLSDWGDCGGGSNDPVRNQILANAINFVASDDYDGDGIPNDEDPHPNSIMTSQLNVDRCNAGVSNLFVVPGTTMADEVNDVINSIWDILNNNNVRRGYDPQKKFQREMGILLTKWYYAGLITDRQKFEITKCVRRSSIFDRPN